MGGWMDYQRVRDRNHLTWRPDFNEDPYWRGELPSPAPTVNRGLLLGDLNRMERSYLAPEVPGSGVGERFETNPAAVCARDTGVDLETVQTVLRHVFGRET